MSAVRSTTVSSLRSLLERAAVGARWGMIAAIVFSAIALASYAAGGSEAFQAKHATLAGVLVAYIATGIAGGVVVGICMPVLKYKPVAAGVGALIALQLNFLFSLGSVHRPDDDGGAIFVAVAMVVFLGIPGGLILRDVLFSSPGKGARKER